MGILNKEQIRDEIVNRDLVMGYIDLETQLQPAGFDLCVDEISEFAGVGGVEYNFTGVSKTLPIAPFWGPWILRPGVYLMKFMEKVNIPVHLAAMTIQRSALMRNGCMTQVGYWDPGYSGVGKSILAVLNKDGISLSRGARVVQMVFHTLDVETEGYTGRYHKET